MFPNIAVKLPGPPFNTQPNYPMFTLKGQCQHIPSKYGRETKKKRCNTKVTVRTWVAGADEKNARCPNCGGLIQLN